ncbi:MAG: sugar phosphate isomerase/epimerase family protein [Terracidiphilus sp.]
MKIGISAFAWTAEFDLQHLKLLPWIKEIGLSGIEIPMFDPANLPIVEIRKACEENGLETTVCAILPGGINPISPDVALRQKSCEHLRRCLDASANLGAKLLGGPLYAPIGYLPGHRPHKDEWLWAIEAFQAVGPLLDSYQMTLSIEPVNRSETFFLRTAVEAKLLCDAIGHSRIGATIDTFHANIEEKSISQAVRLLGPHLKHIHASENDRGLLGEGHVDFATIVDALLGCGYDGYLMIEGFGFNPKETSAPGFLWADTGISPEALAREGMGHLNAILKGTGAEISEASELRIDVDKRKL